MADSVLRQKKSQRYKIYRLIAVSLGVLLSSQSIYAQQEKPREFKHTFSIGLESLHYHYDETTKEHKNFMKDKGLMYGLNGAYQFTYKDSFFVRPEARWTYGHTDYESWRGKDSRKSHIPSMIVETRLLSGWNFKPITSLQNLTLSPYTGIGYRYKSDDTADIKNKLNTSGYKRVNKLWYVPLGLHFNYDFENRWFAQGMAEYNWLIQGQHLTYDKHRAPSPTKYQQKKGYGLKVELLTGYHFDKVSISFGPYLRYWKINKSSTEQVIFYDDRGSYPATPRSEPTNKTRELGIKLNFVF